MNKIKFHFIALLCLACLFSGTVCSQETGSLDPLVEVLGVSGEVQFQLDILKGIATALKGQRDVSEPKGWADLAKRLAESPNTEVRELALSLSLKFGSQAALADLRAHLGNTSVDLTQRKRALEALVEALKRLGRGSEVAGARRRFAARFPKVAFSRIFDFSVSSSLCPVAAWSRAS